jgi:hypothetical protein
LATSNIAIYNSFNYLGSLFSATLVFQLITKVIFNLFAEVKMPLDLWTVTDIFCCFLNIVCFQLIGSATPETIVGTTNADGTINLSERYKLDYYVITVIILSWLRFFTYFLVVARISRLIMTLLRMLYDCIAFMFIFCCYLLIAATIFTTLF